MSYIPSSSRNEYVLLSIASVGENDWMKKQRRDNTAAYGKETSILLAITNNNSHQYKQQFPPADQPNEDTDTAPVATEEKQDDRNALPVEDV